MRQILILLSIVFVFNQSLFAQPNNKQLMEKSPEGREFWLCFMRNHNDASSSSPNATPLDLKLFLTSDKDANVTIEIKSKITEDETKKAKESGSPSFITLLDLIVAETLPSVVNNNKPSDATSKRPIAIVFSGKSYISPNNFFFLFAGFIN